MGKSVVLKCNKCDEELEFTTDGLVSMGNYKVLHYQCHDCRNYQEVWIAEGQDNTVKKEVHCDKCGKKMKRVSFKSVVCPHCGSNEFIEAGGMYID